MKQKPENKQALTDADLQLYLAGVLPWHKTAMLWLLIFISHDLRQRVKQAKEQNRQFRQQEFPRLREKILGTGKRPFTADNFGTASTDTDNALPFRMPFGRTWKLAAGLAFLLVIGSGIYLTMGPQGPVMYAAKGKSLGVHLYTKGASSARVENYTARITGADTLQVVPVGSESQYLIIFGWEQQKGLIRLFPEQGTTAALVSKDSLPPALLLDDPENLKLVCISSSVPREAAEIRTLLSEMPFKDMNQAPSSLLDKDVYVQIYSIEGTRP